jgi:hypothetical protein
MQPDGSWRDNAGHATGRSAHYAAPWIIRLRSGVIFSSVGASDLTTEMVPYPGLVDLNNVNHIGFGVSFSSMLSSPQTL